MMSTVSDMVLARNELARRLREAPTEVPVDGAFERLSAIIAEIRDAITRTRMQRIENLFVGAAAAWCAISRPSSASRCWSTSKVATSNWIAR